MESLPRSSNLRLKKEFSEKDKDDFLRETYDYVAKFFEGSLIELERRNQGTSYSFERIDTRRFAAVVYQAGKTSAECSVRIDSLGGRGSNCIAFSHDANARTNTSNEMLHIEVTDQSICLKPLGMAWGGGVIGVSKYAWTLDERPAKFQAMLSSFAGCLKAPVTFKTDSNTNYAKWITAVFPHARLERVKGKTKKQPAGTPKDYDELFAINNTFARMRHDMNRLARKTWSTSKAIHGLEKHLWLYVAWNNKYPVK